MIKIGRKKKTHLDIKVVYSNGKRDFVKNITPR